MLAGPLDLLSTDEEYGLQRDERLGGTVRFFIGPKSELMQIPADIRKCVAFLGCKRDGEIRAGGTAFFVSRALTSNETGPHTAYAITAAHVIEKMKERGTDGQAYFRLNLKNHGAEWVSLPLSEWEFHDDRRIDVAAAAINIDFRGLDHLFLPSPMFLTQERIQKEQIGPGDDLFFPGLFVRHIGERENLPIIRTGTIAAMPSEPISTKHGNMHAYLVEARSIGGLSGSPVFTHSAGARWKEGGLQIVGRVEFYLMGLVHGHYGVEDIPDTADDTFSDAEKDVRSINMGIAIVVPAEAIRELLDQSRFVEIRKSQLESIQQKEATDQPKMD
jgi:hypothetical protein